MKTSSVLKIERTFSIKGRGLVLVPDLPLPTTGRFTDFNSRVVVHKPDGTDKGFDAEFHLSHDKLVDGGGKWSIIIILPNASKADVPIGSELIVSDDTLDLLQGGSVSDVK